LHVFDVDCEEFSQPCPMPWLGLALSIAFAVVADPKLAVNRWSGCAEDSGGLGGRRRPRRVLFLFLYCWDMLGHESVFSAHKTTGGTG
jgi:hypothetical protein